MEAFVWDQNFITGLPEVDRQHHGLVDLFNELNRTLFHGEDTPAEQLEAVFQRLLAYAAYHFADEEALMASRGLDERHLQPHRSVHRQFVEQVRSMWALRSQLRQPSETIMGFLTSWLGLHILGIDQAMARQMASIERGLSPAQAFELESAHHDQGMQALLKMVGNLYHVLAQQNADLVQANRHLEERVQARTRELAGANDALQAANLQLRALSRTDGLLQIATRPYFDEQLLDEVARARRQSKPLGLLMLDVDFFKRYNDTYGHQAGDACLQAVARAAAGALHRRTDFLARYGGEELVVLLPDTDRDGAMLIAQRVVAAVAAQGIAHAASDAAPVVTLSVGVASALPPPGPLEQAAAALLAQADAALYEAKRSGRNRAVAAPATQ
jgi:hemerythrin